MCDHHLLVYVGSNSVRLILFYHPYASEPENSLACAGDACTGDVVLFEQNVYEM